MQRINLSVDIDDNRILPEEIEKAIEGAVKAKTREAFQKTVDEEVQRVIEKKLEGWTYAGYGYSKSKLQKEVEAKVDAQIIENIGNIKVTEGDIRKRIDEQFELIGQRITYSIDKRLERISLEEYIASIVADEVKKNYPEKVLQLIVKSLSD